MTRTLIIGNGFIGKYLRDFYLQGYEEVITTSRNILDLENEKSIADFFRGQKSFTHIIYAAGIKNVQLCAKDPTTCFNVNVGAIPLIKRYCKDEPKFVYLSTDYIFEGTKGNYTEKDRPNPKTVYGKSKFLGERLTIANFHSPLIVRTSGVYGKGCPWFEWLKQEVLNNKEVRCYTNVINSPTEVFNLAWMINDCLSQNISGTINLCGPKAMNRYELYQIFCSTFQLPTPYLKPINNINPLFPYNISLDCSLYMSLFNKQPITPEEGFIKHEN